MNQKQLEKMKNGKGFIAALDQSGGSTPKALRLYGVEESAYSNDEEMFTLVHEMRTRIIKSPSFTSDRVLAAILFENTMDRKIDDKFTADYLWDVKGIIPILKVDKGLMDLEGGVQLCRGHLGVKKAQLPFHRKLDPGGRRKQLLLLPAFKALPVAVFPGQIPEIRSGFGRLRQKQDEGLRRGRILLKDTASACRFRRG